MAGKACQDSYPDELSHCCGRLNEHGLQLKSHWDGDETVAVFHPRPYHTAIPGVVYGGLIASVIDCHGTGSASAAADSMEERQAVRASRMTREQEHAAEIEARCTCYRSC